MQTLTLSLRMRPVTGTSLERIIRGMVSRGKTYPRYRRGGRFFGRRVNCEHVPLLPAEAVDRILNDPRKIPYLLVWKSRSDGTVQEAVRIAPHNEIEGLGTKLGTSRRAGRAEDGRSNGSSRTQHRLRRSRRRRSVVQEFTLGGRMIRRDLQKCRVRQPGARNDGAVPQLEVPPPLGPTPAVVRPVAPVSPFVTKGEDGFRDNRKNTRRAFGASQLR